MSAVSNKINVEQEKIMDDISDKKVEQPEIDMAKLAELKKKMQDGNKQKNDTKKSIKIGVVGSGQSGGRLASVWYKLGYDAIAINTASQDLKFIELPESNKLLLEYGLGGAAKELDIGREAAEHYKEPIMNMVQAHLADAQVFVLCTSLGGGSGAGSVPVLVDLLASLGKPIVVLTVLPMSSEDAKTKHNSLQTLSSFTKYLQEKKVQNVICVDNAKLEIIYKDVGQFDFYRVANEAIVSPIDVFNTLSSQPSNVKSLDPLEFAKVLTDGEGFSVYGEIKVSNYTDETALAEAVINNLNSNLLAAGFNLKEAKYAGMMFAANKNVWAKIPSAAVNYAAAIVGDVCDKPLGVFRGIYETDHAGDEVLIYSMFSGIGLPSSRVDQLKKESQELSQVAKQKEEARNLNLKIDTGTDNTVSKAQEIKNKIAAKNSSFGKLVNSTVVDRRGNK